MPIFRQTSFKILFQKTGEGTACHVFVENSCHYEKIKHNSKEWLSHRQGITWDFRNWQILCVVKLLLAILFIYSVEQTLVPGRELQRIGYLALIIVLLGCIKEIQASQASIQHSVSRTLTDEDTFHFLEIIPGKAFRIHFREHKIFKQRIRRFKKNIRKTRRHKT